MVMYSNPYRKVRRQEIIGKGLDLEKYVYKITNNITGKVYIGQTNNLKRRIQEHKHDKRCNHPMYTEIHKYGFENFDVEVLYFGSNYDEEEKNIYDSIIVVTKILVTTLLLVDRAVLANGILLVQSHRQPQTL